MKSMKNFAACAVAALAMTGCGSNGNANIVSAPGVFSAPTTDSNEEAGTIRVTLIVNNKKFVAKPEDFDISVKGGTPGLFYSNGPVNISALGSYGVSVSGSLLGWYSESFSGDCSSVMKAGQFKSCVITLDEKVLPQFDASLQSFVYFSQRFIDISPLVYVRGKHVLTRVEPDQDRYMLIVPDQNFAANSNELFNSQLTLSIEEICHFDIDLNKLGPDNKDTYIEARRVCNSYPRSKIGAIPGGEDPDPIPLGAYVVAFGPLKEDSNHQMQREIHRAEKIVITHAPGSVPILDVNNTGSAAYSTFDWRNPYCPFLRSGFSLYTDRIIDSMRRAEVD